MADQVHYEVFVRKTPTSSWVLDCACESRTTAEAVGQDLIKEKKAISVRISKETLDSETMAFSSRPIAHYGAPAPLEKPKPAKPRSDIAICTAPTDFYAPLARDLIGRLLEDWLKRMKVTAFELLHRPDLVEKLDAGTDIQHAIQKIAVPESTESGKTVHEVVRYYQSIADKAVERVIRAGRKNQFASFDAAHFPAALAAAVDAPEREFLIGGGVAAYLSSAANWTEKLDRLLKLMEAAPPQGPARSLALAVTEPALLEIVGSRISLNELIGPGHDIGGQIASLARIAAPKQVAHLTESFPALARICPALGGVAERIARLVHDETLPHLNRIVGRRTLKELNGARRFRPDDPDGEIELLRYLAMIMSAAAGGSLRPEEVQQSFVERSRIVVSPEFIDGYMQNKVTAQDQFKALIRLFENVVGMANKRQAARWLVGTVTSLKFETEFRNNAWPAGQRLQQLAEMQQRVISFGVSVTELESAVQRLGSLGAQIETEHRLVERLGRAGAPPAQKIAALLKMAVGLAAPIGPVADKAKAEAMRLIRGPEFRQVMSTDPAAIEGLRPLLASIGMAA